MDPHTDAAEYAAAKQERQGPLLIGTRAEAWLDGYHSRDDEVAALWHKIQALKGEAGPFSVE